MTDRLVLALGWHQNHLSTHHSINETVGTSQSRHPTHGTPRQGACVKKALNRVGHLVREAKRDPLFEEVGKGPETFR